MKISICVGSSCHLKGSFDVINLMKENLEKYTLTDKTELGAAFCLGRCSSTGVTIQVDDQVITSVTPANFDEMFQTYVLGGGGQ